MAARQSARVLRGLLFLGLAGCAQLQPGLDRDWTETNALVAMRDQEGAYLDAANALMARREYELALRGYTRAIAEHGLTGPVVSGMGAASLQLNRQGQALSLLRRGVEVAPQSPSVWNNLGVALVETGEARAAVEAVRVAAREGPDDDPLIAANLARLEGEAAASAAGSVFTGVRHRSGLYLILESVASGKDDDDAH